MDSSGESSSKRGSYYKYNQSGYNAKLPYAARPRKRKIVNTINTKVNNYIDYYFQTHIKCYFSFFRMKLSVVLMRIT